MKHILTPNAVLVLFAVSVFAGVSENLPGELRVGFGQVDITPPVGVIITGPDLPVSIATDDPLFAKAMVVQGGKRTLVIVGVDLIKIRSDLAEATIAQASQRTGIAHDAVMICTSHNHSSPFIPMGEPNNKAYLSTLPSLIADSIEQAYKALQPARMFLGRSLVYEGHHNRRVISKADGLALNTWLKKLDNLEQTPQVLGTEGPIDPELWVVRFDALDGQVLGTLVNFACHPDLHDRNNLKTWSADFPGVIAEQIAQVYGELFVEWGLSIKKRSPFPHTIVSELTNEWIGYEPTALAVQHEGYETLAGVDFVSLEGIQTLVNTAVNLLEELWKEGGY